MQFGEELRRPACRRIRIRRDRPGPILASADAIEAVIHGRGGHASAPHDCLDPIPIAPEDKRLLQVASVVGKDVPFALLQAIAELPDDALRRGLDHLQAAEFVYETRLFPDLEYSFKHALTHEVTYGGLLQERRRAVHARVVDAIEMLHRDRLGEQIERLAHHAVRGEMRASGQFCSQRLLGDVGWPPSPSGMR